MAARKQRARKSAGRRVRKRRRGKTSSRFLRYAADAGVAAMTMAAALAAFVVFYARDLPSTDGLWAAQRAPKVTLLAVDGSPLWVRGESFGAPVRLADLPAHVPNAVLAVEDRNYYHHIGFNPLSLARALAANAGAGEVVQGGSTITQQLAKNLFLASDRTMKRKIQELLLALWLEAKFTKNEILTLYLNRVYFGAGAYGIDAAARRYFAKGAAELSIGEAAVLAGLLKAPSKYAPTVNPKDAGARARIAIEAMADARFLTKAGAAAALRAPVVLRARRFASGSYFVDHVLAETQSLARAYDADLIVQTTFDPALQAALDRGLSAAIAETQLPADVEAAAVVVDAEGAVRALAGGRDYSKSQFNRATQALRQPGSAFKPFVFLAAIEAGVAPDARIEDAPITVDRWSPANYRNHYYGEVALNQALALSLNSVAVRLQERIGRSAVRMTARRMGLERGTTKGPALALGVDAVSPLELAGAYVPFANGGYRVEAHAVESIRTVDGQYVYRRRAAVMDIAASMRSIRAVNAMMADAVEWGTAKAGRIPGRQVFGKTGTTQDSRDAWFAGHSEGLACVVWVGRDDNGPMPGETGGGPPAIIWREIMRRVLAEKGAGPLRNPQIEAPMLLAPGQSSPDRTPTG
jgi:penicillin-binding protein 1A